MSRSKPKGRWLLAPARCLAHWTITQRTIHVVLSNKPAVLRYEKPNPTGTMGDAIRLAREQAGLTREQLSKSISIPVHWLGRWERDRSYPNADQWQILAGVLRLDSTFPKS